MLLDIVEDYVLEGERTSFRLMQQAKLSRMDIPGLTIRQEECVTGRYTHAYGLCCSYNGRDICTVYGNRVSPNLRSYFFSRAEREIIKRIAACCVGTQDGRDI